jgi:hypothetical protein
MALLRGAALRFHDCGWGVGLLQHGEACSRFRSSNGHAQHIKARVAALQNSACAADLLSTHGRCANHSIEGIWQQAEGWQSRAAQLQRLCASAIPWTDPPFSCWSAACLLERQHFLLTLHTWHHRRQHKVRVSDAHAHLLGSSNIPGWAGTCSLLIPILHQPASSQPPCTVLHTASWPQNKLASVTSGSSRRDSGGYMHSCCR